MIPSPPFVDFGDLRVGGAAQLDADVVIVGSGAGGSTVAATAIELGYSVLMLEEGPYVPADKAPSSLTQSFKRMWRNGGLTVAYGAPPISYAEGRCVGGSTEINSAIFQRAPADLLQQWQKDYCIDKFGEGDLAPYYDWAAATVNASLSAAPLGAPSDILSRTGKMMGWEVKDLERGQQFCVGTNMCSLGCPTGAKSSMTSALIPQLLRKGVRIVAEAKVMRLITSGAVASHVQAIAHDADGHQHRLKVYGKYFFICGGAINTPAILQRTGFGGMIGQKLRMHPTIKCLAFFKEKIDAHMHRLPLVAITEFMPDLRFGGSVFTPATFGLSLAENWAQRAPYIDKMPQAVIYYAMVRGQGHGRVISMPGSLAPIVTYNLAKSDWTGLGTGIAKLGQGLLSVGATQVFPSIEGHTGWQTATAAAQDIDRPLLHNRSQLMTIHLFGSCPIGSNTKACGADSFGLVHGARNIYIADASLIPEAPGVNPQATVMALARRNALHVLEKRS